VTDHIVTSASVSALLERLGLGALNARDGTLPAGRNQNLVGTTSSGHRVFVKCLRGSRTEAVRRFRRLRDFERAIGARGRPAGLLTPNCLGWNDEDLVVVFEWLEGARSGHELASTEEFGDDIAREAGRMVGALHSLVPQRDTELDTDPPRLPPLDLFGSLPLDYFVEASGACLEAWRMMQPDTELTDALRDLRAKEAGAAKTPAHCDLRLDQFLLCDDVLRLCDWEEFRLADPARDVGSFVGEWLYRSVLEIPSRDPGLGDAEASHLLHQEITERGVEALGRLRTRNVAFWDGYRMTRTVADPGLGARAVAFAGWHLIDRMFAGAERRARLTAVERAAAGIGRAAILAPEKFGPTLGLEA
jgi:hypothetical protein